MDTEDGSACEPEQGCLLLESDLMLSGELFGDSDIIGLDRDAGKSLPYKLQAVEPLGSGALAAVSITSSAVRPAE